MVRKARSRKVQLILNGKVAGNDALQSAVAAQREAGHRIEVRLTREKGDARGFVSEATQRFPSRTMYVNNEDRPPGRIHG